MFFLLISSKLSLLICSSSQGFATYLVQIHENPVWKSVIYHLSHCICNEIFSKLCSLCLVRALMYNKKWSSYTVLKVWGYHMSVSSQTLQSNPLRSGLVVPMFSSCDSTFKQCMVYLPFFVGRQQYSIPGFLALYASDFFPLQYLSSCFVIKSIPWLPGPSAWKCIQVRLCTEGQNGFLISPEQTMRKQGAIAVFLRLRLRVDTG